MSESDRPDKPLTPAPKGREQAVEQWLREEVVPATGSKRRLAFGLLLVVWFLKFIFGLVDAIGRNIPRYPDAVKAFPYGRDIEFYVVMPAMFVVLNLLMFVFVRRVPKWPSFITAMSQLLLLLVILFLSAGGI